MHRVLRSPRSNDFWKETPVIPETSTLSTLNTIGIAVSIIDTHMRILWMNDAQIKLTKNSESQLGKYCYSAYRHRRNICKFCPAQKSIKTGKSHTNEMKILVNGTTKYLLITTNPIKNKFGKVLYIVKTVQDMTLIGKREDKEIILIKKLGHTNQKLNSMLSMLQDRSEELKELNKKITLLNNSLKHKVLSKAKTLQVLNKDLMTIYETGKTIVSAINNNDIYDTIVRIACKVSNGKGSMIRLFNKKEEKLVLRAAYGFEKGLCNKYGPLNINESIYSKFVKNHSTVLIEDICNNPCISKEHRDVFRKKGLNAVLIAPILFYNELLGTVSVFYSTIKGSMRIQKMTLQALASEVAMIIKNSQLHENINKTYLDTINTLVMTLEAKDTYTQGHSERVTHYSICLARRLGMSDKQIEVIRRAAKLHDIGKIAVPDTILNKPGKLSIIEKTQIQMHPMKGVEILASVKFLGAGMDLIKYHHERYDGTGYPEGLEKENIPMMARIASVADAFDAMTSDRPYRNKMSIEEAVKEIKKGSGSQFDPHIARIFLDIIDKNLLTKGAFISG